VPSDDQAACVEDTTMLDKSAQTGRNPKDTWERFCSHTIPEPNSGCWIWLSRVDKDGYGGFQVSKKIGKVRAHRFSYEYTHGPILENLVIDHLCTIECCVNPDHLEAVTQATNIARCASHVGKRTHCPSGHPYVGDNLIVNAEGRRCCRTCINANAKKYRERRALRV
jgi:hypothetical protein